MKTVGQAEREAAEREAKRNPPAFPIVHANHTYAPGMTLRDYFAAKAMQGLVAGAMLRARSA